MVAKHSWVNEFIRTFFVIPMSDGNLNLGHLKKKTSWTKEIAKIWHGNWGTVLMPVFPNKLNARYEEWKIVFDGILKPFQKMQK
jgi:hypothetical protein